MESTKEVGVRSPKLELYVRTINAEFPRNANNESDSVSPVNLITINRDFMDKTKKSMCWGKGWGKSNQSADPNLMTLKTLVGSMAIKCEGDEYLTYDPFTKAVFVANTEMVALINKTKANIASAEETEVLKNELRRFYDL